MDEVITSAVLAVWRILAAYCIEISPIRLSSLFEGLGSCCNSWEILASKQSIALMAMLSELSKSTPTLVTCCPCTVRAILVDWIIEVHYKFKLMQETLFLTVNLIDRILNFKKLDRKQLQLIGVSAMLIACKYEEIYSPELRDFVYITDKSYEADEIIKMESEILNYLKFEVCFPSVNRFFEILSIILNFTDKEIVLGRYLMDLFLIDYRYTKYNSSLIACSICYLIKKDERKDKLNDLINLSLSDIGLFKECIKDICFILEYVDQEKLLSIKKKYSSRDNYQFSKIKMKDLL